MGVVQLYLELGLKHILDIEGYDHMLFLLALCIPYVWKDWKRVVILATAFTLGHSITLALASADVVRFPTIWIEFFIPITIIIAALYDLLRKKEQGIGFHYFLAFVFGLIHGMGFSNFLRSAMMPGEESQFLYELLGFNIGIEIGQVFVVILVLLLFTGIRKVLKSLVPKHETIHQKIFSVLIILWAAYMAFERIPA